MFFLSSTMYPLMMLRTMKIMATPKVTDRTAAREEKRERMYLKLRKRR